MCRVNNKQDISFADIKKVQELFEQKGIPLDEITVGFIDGKPYYMWPASKVTNHIEVIKTEDVLEL